ncbi:hypothetical protein DNTS_029007, partial [Danionella cerebrum]
MWEEKTEEGLIRLGLSRLRAPISSSLPDLMFPEEQVHPVPGEESCRLMRKVNVCPDVPRAAQKSIPRHIIVHPHKQIVHTDVGKHRGQAVAHLCHRACDDHIIWAVGTEVAKFALATIKAHVVPSTLAGLVVENKWPSLSVVHPRTRGNCWREGAGKQERKRMKVDEKISRGKFMMMRMGREWRVGRAEEALGSEESLLFTRSSSLSLALWKSEHDHMIRTEQGPLLELCLGTPWNPGDYFILCSFPSETNRKP